MGGGGGLQLKKPKKPVPNLKFAVAFGFFRVFFFGFFRGTFSVFFLSELRQEIPAIQKLCQQCGLGRPRTAQ